MAPLKGPVHRYGVNFVDIGSCPKICAITLEVINYVVVSLLARVAAEELLALVLDFRRHRLIAINKSMFSHREPYTEATPRSSAIILPSFGKAPAATRETSPRSLVTAASVVATAAARPSCAEGHSAIKVMTSCSPARVTTRRSLPSSRCRRPISATWAGCTNMPLIFVVWSARPIQPLIRILVRPHGDSPASTAERSPVARRIIG